MIEIPTPRKMATFKGSRSEATKVVTSTAASSGVAASEMRMWCRLITEMAMQTTRAARTGLGTRPMD